MCAGSGTGKSAFTLSYALQAKTPTLYFSADSNAYTQLRRSVSVATGMPMSESKELILDGRIGEVADALGDYPIRFNFDANPSTEDIQLYMDAYRELYGVYPEIIVLDNITNIRFDAGIEGGQSTRLESLMDWVNVLARESQACVFALHHVNQAYGDGSVPIPLNGIKDQIHRVPALVLTLHKLSGNGFGPDVLRVSPVKNRGESNDSSGKTFAELEFEGSRMLIRDPN